MSLSPAAILHNTSGTEVGTSGAPVRVDPTGTTAQPVTDNGGSLTVDGSVAVSGSVAVTGPLTDSQLRASPVPIIGQASTASISTASVTTSSTSVLASNSSRRGLHVFNDSSTPCFVAFGATATTTAFTFKLDSKVLYEAPFPAYTGAVSGITSSGTATLRVTEVT